MNKRNAKQTRKSSHFARPKLFHKVFGIGGISLRSFVFAFAFLLTIGIYFPATAQSKIVVRVTGETTVESSLINLGDIAEVSGEKSQAERVKNISLGYAPNIGAVRELSRERISLLISSAGYKAQDFRLVSPQTVSVRRAAQEIGATQIREAIETAVQNNISAEVIEMRLIKADLPEKILVPLGKVEIRANLGGVRNLFAPFVVSIEIRVNDAVFRRVSANAEAEGFAEILVAEQQLNSNSKISASDVRLEKRRIEKPLVKYLRDAEELRGKILIKNVACDEEITSDSFISAVVIRNGDPVRIVGQSGKLQIIVNGEARAAGKIGDRIAVKNLQSNIILQAVVVDEGLVKINF